MKTGGSDKSPAAEIDSLVSRIGDNVINEISGIYLDETLMEFYSLQNEIPVPSIPVGELDYSTGVEITKNLVETIPEYLRKHTLLEKRKPSSEQHSLHFIKLLPGRLIDFVHILRFDFKLSGGTGIITGKGNNQSFPEYKTDRIRYKSRLVPVLKESDPLLIDSLRLKSQLEVDTDGKRFTSVFFDEFSTTEISIDFSTKAGNDLYLIPPKIYQFISYDYFTACMNVPDPSVPNLERAAVLYEPLFFYLYFQYRERAHEINESQLAVFDEYLECGESGVSQKPLLQDSLRDFFSRYTLYRDDDLLLKGLRKININKQDLKV
jgi:hypothetical protein